MNAVLLPGNSARHREWVEALKVAVSPQFQIVKALAYLHWQTGEEKADVDYELAIAKSSVTELDPYMIIGKSIGTVIAVRGVAEGVLRPTKLILLGIPINGGAPKELFAQWLRHINAPVVVVQNTHDPLGSFADVKAAFRGCGEAISFVELPGDTHDYLDFEAITKLI